MVYYQFSTKKQFLSCMKESHWGSSFFQLFPYQIETNWIQRNIPNFKSSLFMHISSMLSTNQKKTAKEKIICYNLQPKTNFIMHERKPLRFIIFSVISILAWNKLNKKKKMTNFKSSLLACINHVKYKSSLPVGSYLFAVFDIQNGSHTWCASGILTCHPDPN
jgi:hypothetical protein